MKKILLLLILALNILGCQSKIQVNYIRMGTSGPTGLYYPTGKNLITILNRKSIQHNMYMVVEYTSGSVYNISAILNKDIQLALVQSDTQFQAYNGKGIWKEKGPQKKLFIQKLLP